DEAAAAVPDEDDRSFGPGCEFRHEVSPLAERVASEPARLSLHPGKIGREHMVARGREEGNQAFPTPAAVPSTVDQNKSRHLEAPLPSARSEQPSKGEKTSATSRW